MTDTHKFVFIVGLHRSGTTLLAQCLAEHPQVSGFRETGFTKDEGQFLQTVYPPAHVYGSVGKFGFNSKTHLNENSSIATRENANRLMEEWGRHWDLNKGILLEKSPPNILKTRFLQKMFPNSYFICIMRHPIAAGYATQKWSKTDIFCLLRHWILCYNIFFRDAKCLHRVIIVRYEDLIRDPHAAIFELCRFIGIPQHEFHSAVEQGKNEQYFEKWRKELSQCNRFGKVWQSVRIWHFQHRLSKFGYSLKV